MTNRLRMVMAVIALVPQVVLCGMAYYTSLGSHRLFIQLETATQAISLILLLLLPGPAWSWLIGDRLAALRQFCSRVKLGNYQEPLALPNEATDGEEELTTLMRDMNWMARRIELREKDLEQAVVELSMSRQLMDEQNQVLTAANIELRVMQQSLEEKNRALETAYQRMKEMALTDSLTTLANRRCFFETLGRQTDASRTSCAALSLLMIDVDRFKMINDTFGHPIGDKVLQELAGLIRGNTRYTDLSARIGGEEYAVLMPDTLCREALQVARRIHEAVCHAKWLDRVGIDVAVTISIGVCTIPVFRRCTDGERLFHGADMALYHSKNHGRNAISVYDDCRSVVEKIA